MKHVTQHQIYLLDIRTLALDDEQHKILNDLDADGVLIGDIEMAIGKYLDVRPIAAALKSIHKK